jgi:predicted O-methyltransferase YrrM
MPDPRANSHASAVDIRAYESALDVDGAEDLRDCLLATAALPGDVVECGSWRGGSAMFMADVLRAAGVDKRVLACDSFEGFDLDELHAERAAGATTELDDAFASTSLKYVEAKIAQRVLQGLVIPVRGYFEATLPKLRGPFSLVVIDCDLGRSATFAAATLWPRLVGGGLIVFDDYANERAFRGMRGAVDAFIASHQLEIAEHGLLRRLYRARRGQRS